MMAASLAAGSRIDVGEIKAGRDAYVDIKILTEAAAASKFSGKVRAFLEEYLITEKGSGTVPFGGRDRELAHLMTGSATPRPLRALF